VIPPGGGGAGASKQSLVKKSEQGIEVSVVCGTSTISPPLNVKPEEGKSKSGKS